MRARTSGFKYRPSHPAVRSSVPDTMSAGRLELIGRFWDSFSSESITSERLRSGWMDWLLDEFYAPEPVFDLRAMDWTESPVYEGRDDLRDFWETWFGTWELERLETVGEQVLSVAVERGVLA